MSTVAPVRHRSAGSVLTLAVAVILCSAGQASAQGLFEFLFGRAFNSSPSTPAAATPHAGVNPGSSGRRSEGSGERSAASGAAYCVRLCDGRYFPVQHHRESTPAEMCSKLCPASQTKIFRGGDIGRAVAADGTRYAALSNAFVYRDRVVPGCTCNGKSSFGLASIPVEADPTLRAGDAVATAEGAKVVTGKSFSSRTAGESAKSKSAKPPASFVPVTNDGGRLSDIRQKLGARSWAQARE
jgi:hypothetical protein